MRKKINLTTLPSLKINKKEAVIWIVNHGGKTLLLVPWSYYIHNLKVGKTQKS